MPASPYCNQPSSAKRLFRGFHVSVAKVLNSTQVDVCVLKEKGNAYALACDNRQQADSNCGKSGSIESG
jgi:hypothetical protein